LGGRDWETHRFKFSLGEKVNKPNLNKQARDSDMPANPSYLGSIDRMIMILGQPARHKARLYLKK
jgi:hypothetical protein